MLSLARRLRALHGPAEEGAALIIFAITAVVLFGFSAIAVDGAHAFVQKRESQSAADVSAIAGAFTLLDNTGTDAQMETGLVAKVKEIAAQNLGEGLDWDGCVDVDRPGGYINVAADTDCISWTYKWRQVRVHIPNRQIPTFFASVIGFDTMNVSAAAEVSSVIESGAVLPLGLLEGQTSGLQCGKTGTHAPECEANSSGNFQYLDFTQFGSAVFGTDEVCSGQTTNRVIDNLADGIDHFLELSPPNPKDHTGIVNADSIWKDSVECGDLKRDAMAVLSQTGLQAQSLSRGLIFSTDPKARLTQGNLDIPIDYDGTTIDYAPIWHWMTPTTLTACEAQNLLDDPADLDPDVDTQDEAVKCIDEHKNEEIFIKDLGSSPRLALVPQLHQSSWPSGGKYVTFKSFVFVYIQSMYGGCNNAGCKTIVTPGEVFQIAKGNKPSVEAMTVIVLPDVTIPETVRDEFLDPVVEAYVLIR